MASPTIWASSSGVSISSTFTSTARPARRPRSSMILSTFAPFLPMRRPGRAAERMMRIFSPMRSISIREMPAKPYSFFTKLRIRRSSTSHAPKFFFVAYQRDRQPIVTPVRNAIGLTFWPIFLFLLAGLGTGLAFALLGGRGRGRLGGGRGGLLRLRPLLLLALRAVALVLFQRTLFEDERDVAHPLLDLRRAPDRRRAPPLDDGPALDLRLDQVEVVRIDVEVLRPREVQGVRGRGLEELLAERRGALRAHAQDGQRGVEVLAADEVDHVPHLAGGHAGVPEARAEAGLGGRRGSGRGRGRGCGSRHLSYASGVDPDALAFVPG